MLGWALNLGFAGSGAAAPVVVETSTGGGIGKRRSKYPRRVLIGGNLVWVRSASEERELIAQYIARLEAQAERLTEQQAPPAKVARARVAIVKAARRLEKVDDREAQWLARLQDEDEEILLLLH